MHIPSHTFTTFICLAWGRDARLVSEYRKVRRFPRGAWGIETGRQADRPLLRTLWQQPCHRTSRRSWKMLNGIRLMFFTTFCTFLVDFIWISETFAIAQIAWLIFSYLFSHFRLCISDCFSNCCRFLKFWWAQLWSRRGLGQLRVEVQSTQFSSKYMYNL